MVAISPQTLEQSRRAVDDFAVDFPLLADEGNRTAGEYGLSYSLPEDLRRVFLDVLGTDLDEYNGAPGWRLPMPARYLIDTGGTVRWASVSADYTRRPDPADTLEALRAMKER